MYKIHNWWQHTVQHRKLLSAGWWPKWEGIPKERAYTYMYCLQCGRPGFNPWVGKILWRRKWQSTPVLLPGKSHGQRSLVGCSPRDHKQSDTTEQLHFHFQILFKIWSKWNTVSEPVLTADSYLIKCSFVEEAWTSSSRPFHPVLPGAFVEFSPWFHLSWLGCLFVCLFVLKIFF